MKVRLDVLPSNKNNPCPYFAIRLLPETNEDMANMEWGLAVMGDIKPKITKNFNDEMQYIISFENKRK